MTNSHQSDDVEGSSSISAACSTAHDTPQAKTDEEFSTFYRAMMSALVGFLVNQGASPPLATDIAQDTMMAAYRNWAEIRLPKPWVHTVASRALLRRITDTREAPFAEIPEATSLLPEPDRFAEWELRHDLQGLLMKLPPRQRQVLAWTFNGFTPSEIALQLGMTNDAVRASLRKARRAAVEYESGKEPQ